MGRPKHLLELGGRTFLEWCHSALAKVVDEIVVSLANDQEAPSLSGVVYVRDHVSYSGPLAGVAASLERCTAEYVVVVSCDAPLVNPKLLEVLFEEVGDYDAAIASISGRPQFFPGVYRRELFGSARTMLKRGRRSMAEFVGECRVRLIPEGRVRTCDPDFASFLNVNTPDEYASLAAER